MSSYEIRQCIHCRQFDVAKELIRANPDEVKKDQSLLWGALDYKTTYSLVRAIIETDSDQANISRINSGYNLLHVAIEKDRRRCCWSSISLCWQRRLCAPCSLAFRAAPGLCGRCSSLQPWLTHIALAIMRAPCRCLQVQGVSYAQFECVYLRPWPNAEPWVARIEEILSRLGKNNKVETVLGVRWFRPLRTVSSGFTVTQAMYIVVLLIGQLYEHHMVPESVCAMLKISSGRRHMGGK